MNLSYENQCIWWYTAWFENLLLDPDDPDDQDHIWPACIIIQASSQEKASEWGEYLSRKYFHLNEHEVFIKSEVEPYVKDAKIDDSHSPRIEYGYEASDDEIGW